MLCYLLLVPFIRSKPPIIGSNHPKRHRITNIKFSTIFFMNTNPHTPCTESFKISLLNHLFTGLINSYNYNHTLHQCRPSQWTIHLPSIDQISIKTLKRTIFKLHSSWSIHIRMLINLVYYLLSTLRICSLC